MIKQLILLYIVYRGLKEMKKVRRIERKFVCMGLKAQYKKES